MSECSAVWDRFSWKVGDDHFSFELQDFGKVAVLTIGDKEPVRLPFAGWEALLDAVGSVRKSRKRRQQDVPARAGARWSPDEAGAVEASYQSGMSVADLAERHGRTTGAIERHLEKAGLMEPRFRAEFGGSPHFATSQPEAALRPAANSFHEAQAPWR